MAAAWRVRIAYRWKHDGVDTSPMAVSVGDMIDARRILLRLCSDAAMMC